MPSQIDRLIELYYNKVTNSKAYRYLSNVVAGVTAGATFYGLGVLIAAAVSSTGVGIPIGLAIFALLGAIGLNEYKIRKKLDEDRRINTAVKRGEDNAAQVSVLADSHKDLAARLKAIEMALAKDPKAASALTALNAETKAEQAALVNSGVPSHTALQSLLAHVPDLDPTLLQSSTQYQAAASEHKTANERTPLVVSEGRDDEPAYDMSAVAAPPSASLAAIFAATPAPANKHGDEKKKEAASAPKPKKKRSLSADGNKADDFDDDAFLNAFKNLHLHAAPKSPTGVTGAQPPAKQATEKSGLLGSAQKRYG